MIESRAASPLGTTAALLTTGTTAAQIAAELEAAAAATEARWQEMAPYWAVRAALWQDAEKVVAADRALKFLAGTPFVSEAAAASPAVVPSTREATIAEPAPAPVVPAAPVAAVAAAEPAKPLASALVEPFFEFRATIKEATHQVMGQERGTLRRFIEAQGDRPVDGYDRGDITDFLDTLRQLPTTYGKSPRDRERSLADIIAEARRGAARSG